MATGTIKNTKQLVFEYTFTVAVPAGAIGTRGGQVTVVSPHPVNKLRGISIISIGDSATSIPLVFANGDTLYCNFYRCVTTAINPVVMARFVYDP